MRRLLVIRHGKSRWDVSGVSDFERPLAPRGIKAAGRMASWISNSKLHPELIVSSPAVRALHTAQILSGKLDVPLREEPQIYDADCGELLAVVQRLPDAKALMLVGHNFGLEELVDYLSGLSDTVLKTCSLAVLESRGDNWSEASAGSFRRTALVHPREL